MVTWPHLQYNLSHLIKFCWRLHGQKIWRHNLHLKIPFLRRPRLANLADIIKIATIFIKTTSKDSKKVKRIRYYVLKCNLYLYFLIQLKLLITGEKSWCQQNSRVVSRDLCYFGSSLSKVNLSQVSSLQDMCDRF